MQMSMSLKIVRAAGGCQLHMEDGLIKRKSGPSLAMMLAFGEYHTACTISSGKARADTGLPRARHEHRQREDPDENRRSELSRQNFGRFLKRWGARPTC